MSGGPAFFLCLRYSGRYRRFNRIKRRPAGTREIGQASTRSQRNNQESEKDTT
jgi:hypothetical protein